MKRFLVLGTGLVAEPMIEYLNRNSGNHITVVGYTLLEAQSLAGKYESVKALQADVSDKEMLNTLVIGCDVVVSLVPAHFHLLIAKVCIKHKVNMVTASYQIPEMKTIAEDAKTADICILNEIGLDPGIDHLAAMEIIDKTHESGESIESFVSWCGGIPAPESNDNPLSYKFSWEPRGAIMVLLNDAVYQKNQQVIKIAGADLMRWSQAIEIDGMNLECYPNRESVSYKNIYGITEVKDIIRGTLRYRGFCDIFQDVKNLGLMQVESGKVANNISWKHYLAKLNDNKSIETIKTSISETSYQALKWLGVFSDQLVAQKNCSLDALCELMLEKLNYQSKDKDLVILQHKFVIKKPDNSRYFITSTLKKLGDSNGYTAMAKTVGYPVAIASQLIADNIITSKGLLLPVTQEIYQPMLELLKNEGIYFEEKLMTEKEITKESFIKELV